MFVLKILGGSAAQVGIYAAAQNISLVVGIFGLSISPLLLSTMSRVLREGNPEKARGFASNAMRSVIALLPFWAIVAGTADEIVSFIFGIQFAAAAPLLVVLLFAALAMVMITVTRVILIAAGKPRWTFALTGPLLPVAIVGHLIIVPSFGALGAAGVTASVACMGALVSVLAVRHTWQILPPATTLLRSVLLSALAYPLAVLWPATGFLVLLKLPIIGVVILGGYLLLGEFRKQEIHLFRSLFVRAF
jgi:O-antigen/teichoic acid export membrane protein